MLLDLCIWLLNQVFDHAWRSLIFDFGQFTTAKTSWMTPLILPVIYLLRLYKADVTKHLAVMNLFDRHSLCSIIDFVLWLYLFSVWPCLRSQSTTEKQQEKIINSCKNARNGWTLKSYETVTVNYTAEQMSSITMQFVKLILISLFFVRYMSLKQCMA